MKKICFLTLNNFLLSGCTRVTTDLANALSEFFDVSILSFCGNQEKENYFVNRNVYIYDFGKPYDFRARESVLLAKKLISFLKNKKIDVLISSGSFALPLLALIKPFIKCKIIFWDHENIEGRDWKSILFRKIGCKICDKTVVLTEKTLRDYKRIVGVSDDKIFQIYNFVNEEPCDGECDIYSKKIISVGRVSPEKGYEMAVRVAKDVFSKHPDWCWDIYGDGTDFEKIKLQIKHSGLENNMFLKGSTSRVREKYKDYAICVLTSYREGFAMVLVEAKINKLPLVSFDCVAGPSEIISDGVDGFLIPCYNKSLMAEKICELIENLELRKSFFECSQNNIFKFQKDKVINNWREIIECS